MLTVSKKKKKSRAITQLDRRTSPHRVVRHVALCETPFAVQRSILRSFEFLNNLKLGKSMTFYSPHKRPAHFGNTIIINQPTKPEGEEKRETEKTKARKLMERKAAQENKILSEEIKTLSKKEETVSQTYKSHFMCYKNLKDLFPLVSTF